MSMIYGYCRVSTPSQSLERQKTNILKAYPDAKIYSEKYTGKIVARPVFKKLCSMVKSGDTVVFDSVSRMSRNAEEGFKLYKEWYNNDVTLVFLKEPLINTDQFRQASSTVVPMTGTDVDVLLAAVNEYILRVAEQHIKTAFQSAEHENTMRSKATAEGIAMARYRGKTIGRPYSDSRQTKKMVNSIPIMKKHCKCFGGNLSDAEVIQLCGVTRKTFYCYKRQIIAEMDKKHLAKVMKQQKQEELTIRAIREELEQIQNPCDTSDTEMEQ